MRGASTASQYDSIINAYLFTASPHLFEGDEASYRSLKQVITESTGVEPSNVEVVGSAKIGYSLSPHKFPSPFHAKSDVDLIIVSSDLFDQAWLDILHAATESRNRYSPRLLEYLDDHRSRHFIFDGWVWPDEITRCLGIGPKWFETLKRLGPACGREERDFHTRLYKSWDHARAYHRKGLRSLAIRNA